MKFVLAAPLLALMALPTQASADNPVIMRAIDGFVRPAYQQFHQSTSVLASDISKLCSQPTASNLGAARVGFVEAVEMFSQVEIIRFGPVTEESRLERLLFWPDRKGIGLKQVQAALADKDPTAADAARLAGKSVAMQGFGALEFVLFGTGSDGLAAHAEAYRCTYGRAIASNLDGIASAVSDAWQSPGGFAKIWSEPSPANAIYHTDDEALTELLDALVHGMEQLRDVRFNGFLGDRAQADKPRLAVFWRSQATTTSLAGNLRGMRRLFESSDLGANLPANSQWVGESIGFEFGNAEKALSGLAGPIDAILADPKARGKLAYARVVTSSLSNIIGTRFAAAFGLTAGFSSLDGD